MTDTDRIFQMSVKTTNYILLVVCSFRSNTKREGMLEIGLVCCFIPIPYIASWCNSNILVSFAKDVGAVPTLATSRIYCKVN